MTFHFTHTYVHTYTHKHTDTTPRWEYTTDPVGACLMLTRRNIRPSLQCSPSPTVTHICTYCKSIDIPQSFCLSFYILIIRRPVGLHIQCALCACDCVCSRADSGFSLLLTSRSPANSVSMETGGGRQRAGMMLTSWHLLSRGTPTVSNSICVWEGLCVCVRIFFSHMWLIWWPALRQPWYLNTRCKKLHESGNLTV